MLLLLIRVFSCIVGAGLLLYAYIDRQNELTELRLQLPHLAKQVKGIQEENNRLYYEIDRFESPIHLLELSGKPEFGHLKHPYLRDIIIIDTETSSSEQQALENP